MKNFVYSIPTKVFFGKGQIEKIGPEILKYGKKVLLVYGKGSIKSNGIYDKAVEILKAHGIEYFELGGVDPNPRTETVYKGAEICKENSIDLILAYDKAVEILKAHGIEYFELGGVDPNPRTETVYKGAEICKENSIDLILAMGGGSTIDCAKAISLQSKYDGDFWTDFYIKGRRDLVKEVTPVASILTFYIKGRRDLVKEVTPVASILTLAATGSEMNGSTVISNTALNLKIGFNHPCLKPVFSVEDPEYTYSVSRYQTCAGAIDIMSHLFEQYFSAEKDGFMQNRIIEGLLKTIFSLLKIRNIHIL